MVGYNSIARCTSHCCTLCVCVCVYLCGCMCVAVCVWLYVCMRVYGAQLITPVSFNKTLDVPTHVAQQTADGRIAASATMVRYTLYAVVVHQGSSPHHGHYFTYARASDCLGRGLDDTTAGSGVTDERKEGAGGGSDTDDETMAPVSSYTLGFKAKAGMWHQFDDSNVTQASESAAMSRDSRGAVVLGAQATPYMLWYRRDDLFNPIAAPIPDAAMDMVAAGTSIQFAKAATAATRRMALAATTQDGTDSASTVASDAGSTAAQPPPIPGRHAGGHEVGVGAGVGAGPGAGAGTATLHAGGDNNGGVSAVVPDVAPLLAELVANDNALYLESIEAGLATPASLVRAAVCVALWLCVWLCVCRPSRPVVLAPCSEREPRRRWRQ